MKLFKEALKILEKSKEYKEWKKGNPNTYISHALFVVEDKDSDWQIGYYNTDHGKVASFTIGEEIKLLPEEDVLQEKKKAVEEVKVSKVKHDLADAMNIAVDLQKEEYSAEFPTKVIAVLQTIEKKQVWNITFLTQSFNTLNFKIKCEDLAVIGKKLQPLFRFDKGGLDNIKEGVKTDAAKESAKKPSK